MDGREKHEVALSLGANKGDRLETLKASLKALMPYVSVKALSPVYETLSAYATDQPAYLNFVLYGETALEPHALLYTIKDIERDMGRAPTYRYGARVIDIDILFYADRQLTTTELTLPHPRMAERPFVLAPLSKVAPEWKHPVLGKTAEDMLAALPDPTEGLMGCTEPLTIP